MNIYASKDIRNVAVAGHAHCGKSTLVEALLATAGAIPAMGQVEDGSAVTAYDEEDVARRTTLSNAVAHCEWNGIKVNLIDTPGSNAFVQEARAAMLPVELALIVADAAQGVEPMTQRVWSYAQEFNLPRVVAVNRVDREHAEPLVALDALQQSFGRQVAAVQLPIGAESGFRGVVDLVAMRAYEYALEDKGRGREIPIPKELAEQAQSAHEALVELVAEGKDELMEEYFAKGTIPEEDLVPALHEAIREDRIFPVLFVSGLAQMGCDRLLEFLRVYAPAPSEREPVAAVAGLAAAQGNGKTEHNGAPRSGNWPVEMVTRPVSDAEPLALFCFKTLSDPFAGQISFFKIFSGCVHSDDTVMNFTQSASERLAHLCVMQGKRAMEVRELHAGDIGAVPKLKNTRTGDSLGEKSHPVHYEPVKQPEPVLAFAIEARTRADEDKLANAMHRIMEEDTLVRFYRDPQTQEFLLAGSGQQHIETVVSRLRRRYHTEVSLQAPRIPYRETIRVQAEGHGRHKKQSGGHGQFGDCKIRIEPLERGAGIEFVNQIFGGAIPKNFIPAVEKGIRDAAERGFMAGYPLVDFRATVYDGSYHEVDSNEISFRIAGRLALRACMEQARPALLEPVLRAEIQTPEAFAGAVMGDLNGRRGRVLGMDSSGAGQTVIQAEVPMAEMLTYGVDLVAMTQGQGSFHAEADHYDFLPAALQEKVVAASRQLTHAAAADEE